MKCQECDKPATHHVTDIIASKLVEIHVCEAHFQKLDDLATKAGPPKPEPGFGTFVDVPALRQALCESAVRQKVAAYLLPALCLALLDDKPEVRVAAAFRLLILGPHARPASGALRDALRDLDERVRKAAEITLEYIQTDQEPPWFFG
jgi:hypothetical protein